MSSTTTNDLQTTFKLINRNFTLIVIVALAIWGGYNWNRAESLLKNGGPTAGNVAGIADQAPTQPSGPTESQLGKMPKVDNKDHIRGNEKARVVLVEYSDFECPFCARFHPTMQQVVEEMGDQVAWVYRHYPLSFHPNAQKAAEGSECVAKLGGNDAFWKYSDALADVTSADGKLSPDAILEAAAQAGVNATSFKSCLDSDEMAQVVKDQASTGGTAGVTGTPGTIVVVDGEAKELIPGALPYASVKTTIEKYLN
ncbi:MAG: thioredoxin domain-containing protein [Candidatus Pacebacteria bacterium]|nr:thioredoxin domain-containing protein [Candidatus Paceibacterota bacterium]